MLNFLTPLLFLLPFFALQKNQLTFSNPKWAEGLIILENYFAFSLYIFPLLFVLAVLKMWCQWPRCPSLQVQQLGCWLFFTRPFYKEWYTFQKNGSQDAVLRYTGIILWCLKNEIADKSLLCVYTFWPIWASHVLSILCFFLCNWFLISLYLLYTVMSNLVLVIFFWRVSVPFDF